MLSDETGLFVLLRILAMRLLARCRLCMQHKSLPKLDIRHACINGSNHQLIGNGFGKCSGRGDSCSHIRNQPFVNCTSLQA